MAEMAPRQMLHAFQLAFVHPYTGKKLSFVSPPPEDFRTCAFASAHTLQKVVITGNPGSGKSTVSNFFRSRGVPCFSADEEVAALYQPESEVALWLAGHGGSHLLDCTGGIDRAVLFAAFQKDRHFKQELESVLHAWVFAGLERFFARHSARDLVVAEIPLYFECEKASEGLVSVCVFCPRAIRFARLAATRGWSAEKSAQIESWQWPEEQKKRASTLVLENSGDQQKLAEACAQLWERLRELRLADKERDQKKILSFFEDKTK